jgi:hypothetical protein
VGLFHQRGAARYGRRDFRVGRGAIYLAYTNPTGTEFGPFMVLMTLPITVGAVLAWMAMRLLRAKPPA